MARGVVLRGHGRFAGDCKEPGEDEDEDGRGPTYLLTPPPHFREGSPSAEAENPQGVEPMPLAEGSLSPDV